MIVRYICFWINIIATCVCLLYSALWATLFITVIITLVIAIMTNIVITLETIINVDDRIYYDENI